MAMTKRKKTPLKKHGTTIRRTKNALQIAINVKPEDAIKYFDMRELMREQEKKRTRKVPCIPEKVVNDLTIFMEFARSWTRRGGKKEHRFLTDKKIYRYQQMLMNRTCPVRKRKKGRRK